MTNPAGVSRACFGHVLLCILAVSGLAACGSDGAASSAATSSSTGSLISPQIGMIDRTPNSDPIVGPGLQAPTQSPPTAAEQQPGMPPVKVTDGAATLDWTPPTQNSDGTVLTNLAGYTVYYGTSPENLTQSIKVTNPGLTAFTVTNLSSGTWYFVVTSYSAGGFESTRSGVISTKI